LIGTRNRTHDRPLTHANQTVSSSLSRNRGTCRRDNFGGTPQLWRTEQNSDFVEAVSPIGDGGTRERADRNRARGEQSLREQRAKTGLTRRYLRTTRLLNLWERRWKEREFRVVRGARIHRVERIAHDGGRTRLMRYTHIAWLLCIYPAVSLRHGVCWRFTVSICNPINPRPFTILRPRLATIITIYRDDCGI